MVGVLVHGREELGDQRLLLLRSATISMLLSPIVSLRGGGGAGAVAARRANQPRTVSMIAVSAVTPWAAPTMSAPIAATSTALVPSGASPRMAWSTESTSSTWRISSRSARASWSSSAASTSSSGPGTNATVMS